MSFLGGGGSGSAREIPIGPAHDNAWPCCPAAASHRRDDRRARGSQSGISSSQGSRRFFEGRQSARPSRRSRRANHDDESFRGLKGPRVVHSGADEIEVVEHLGGLGVPGVARGRRLRPAAASAAATSCRLGILTADIGETLVQPHVLGAGCGFRCGAVRLRRVRRRLPDGDRWAATTNIRGTTLIEPPYRAALLCARNLLACRCR